MNNNKRVQIFERFKQNNPKPETELNTILSDAIPIAKLMIDTIFVILKKKLLCLDKNNLFKTRNIKFIFLILMLGKE